MAGSPLDRFEVLRSLMDAAGLLARELTDDPILERLLAVFARMPDEDREVILGIIEHEVQERLLARDVGDSMAQVELRPNPKAQLYFRVIGPEPKNEVELFTFLRGLQTVQRAIGSFDARWRGAIFEALRRMEPADRARIDAFNTEVRLLLDECARAVPAEPEPASSPAINDVPSRGR
jgi:hypothetical protein